jgi:hypothetical protein
VKVPVWRAPRVEYCAQGRVWVRRESCACQTVNLSESGLLVIVPVPCEPGTPIRIDLPLPGYSRPMPIPSVVVRETIIDGEYAVGVRFESMLPGSLEVLRGFLTQELASKRSSDALQPIERSSSTPGIDLGELDRLPPAEDGAAEPVLEPILEPIDAEPDASGREGSASDAGEGSRPRVGRRIVKKHVAERLKAVAAAAAKRKTDQHPAVEAPAPSKPPPSDEFEEVPEHYDPNDIYGHEEQDLVEELPQDSRLRGLYRAAVADVDRADEEFEKKKKRKGWF